MSKHEQIMNRISQRLAFIYGTEKAPAIMAALERLLAHYEGRIKPRCAGWSEKDALLITYADSLLGSEPPLRTLHAFLKKHVSDAITFVHLLPFYPFSSDDGFAVQDFRVVRPELGGWQDIAAFAEDYHLNFANPKVLLEIVDVLLFYASQGASMIRLDAITYLWKRLGTACVHLPETHEIIDLGPAFFAVRRLPGAMSRPLIALHNVTAREQETIAARLGLAGASADVLSGKSFDSSLRLAPYEFVWLTPR